MPSHTFSSTAPQLTVPLQPLAGATAAIIRFTVKKGPEPAAGETVRLAHLRLAKEGKIRETQIVELIYRDGAYTAGFSGFGGGEKAMKNPENKLKLKPFHIGPVAGAAIPVVLTVPLKSHGEAVVSVGPKTATSVTEILPGEQPLSLLLGFQGEGDLHAPVGWTISWEDNAVEWVGATGTVNPPTPPLNPPLPPFPPPGTGQPVSREDAITMALQLLAPHLTKRQIAVIQILLEDGGE